MKQESISETETPTIAEVLLALPEIGVQAVCHSINDIIDEREKQLVASYERKIQEARDRGYASGRDKASRAREIRNFATASFQWLLVATVLGLVVWGIRSSFINKQKLEASETAACVAGQFLPCYKGWERVAHDHVAGPEPDTAKEYEMIYYRATKQPLIEVPKDRYYEIREK